MIYSYIEPVSRLLKLGLPEEPWLDYSALGLTSTDVPELIRLVQDHELHRMFPPEDPDDDEDFSELYAQIHAWRALGELHSEASIPALLNILWQIDEDQDDWLSADVDAVFGMIGVPAVEPLAMYLSDESNPMYARSAAGSSLAEIGKRHPEVRAQCILGIAVPLEKFETNHKVLNGFLIGDLVDLKAVEQINLIKRVFEGDAVDELINGDVEDVMIDVGLLENRLTPPHPWRFPLMDTECDGSAIPS